MKTNVKKINDKTKKVIYIISFSLLVLLFISLVILTKDSKKIQEIKEFIKIDIRVLYVTDDDSLNYPVEILDKYSISYKKINSTEFTIFEKRKLENIINSSYLNNILVIYKDGVIIDALIEYDSQEKVNEFLQKNALIPDKIVDNVDEIIKQTEKILDNKYSIVYMPYKDHNEIDDQDDIFKDISNEYSIEYSKIDVFSLSSSQQEKINSILGLSDVENQILILVKDNKMIANIRGIHSKNTYIEALYDLDFIAELKNKIKVIDYNEFKSELKDENKSIILLGINNSKDCEEIFNILNKMSYNYNIEVKYINLESTNSEIYKKVNEKLLNIGYTEGFSLPLVVIVESNQVLDYIIGNSSEEYFLDVFIENGVIKGDVINE